jgi:hypothetical protein
LNKLTNDEIETRVWAFVVISITAVLFFIVISLIYRTTFVIQPLKSISPMDQADQKMLNDIVLLIVGAIGGVAGKKVAGGVASTIGAIKQATAPTMPMNCYGMQGMGQMGQNFGANGANFASSQPFGSLPTFKNPQFDESWTPPPPPSGPPVLEDEATREHMALARAEAKNA